MQVSGKAELARADPVRAAQGLSRVTRLAAFGAIALLALLVYSNSFHCAFQFDDLSRIVENGNVRGLGITAWKFDWMSIHARPLAYLSFALNYHCHGLAVFGYHATNLAIHIMGGCFAFLLAHLLLGLSDAGKSLPEKRVIHVALFSALLFVAHPIQTQAVTYIIQRMASMAAMFYLMALYFYTKGRVVHSQSSIRATAGIYYVAALIAGMCAVWSKEPAATFPLAMLLVEACFIRDLNGQPFRRYLSAAGAVLAIAMVSAVILWGLPRDPEAGHVSRVCYLITEFSVVTKYLQLLILPIGQNVDYDFPLSSTIWGIRPLASMAILVGLLAWGTFLVHKKRIMTFAIFFFFLTLSVESSVFPIGDVIFEHRLYLPMFGFSLFLGALLFSIPLRISTSCALAMTLLALYAVAAYQRNKTWATPLSLWSDTVAKSPGKARPHKALGDAYAELGAADRAIEMYRKAIGLNPKYSDAYYNLGNTYRTLGDNAKAMEMYWATIRVAPAHARAHNNIGVFYTMQGNIDRAIEMYRKAIVRDPLYAEAWKNLGVACLKKEQAAEGIEYLKKAAQLGEQSARAWLVSQVPA